MLDVDVPVGAVRHHVVAFATMRGGVPEQFPMFSELGKGYYVRPEEQGALLGFSSPDERADRSELFQMDFDWAYYERLRPSWEATFPAIAGRPIARAWTGAVDFTPDHLPIVDQPRPGFYVLAAGGHGMMWGPALGLKMAELITDGTLRELPTDEVRMSRFAAPRATKDAIALPFPAWVD